MRNRLRSGALLLGLFLTSSATAAENVADLITRLGSDQFTDRLIASERLVDLGPAALDALRTAARSDDAEVRRRAEDLITVINRRVENDRLLTAKRVRLVFKDTPVLTAIADFGNLTGYKIQPQGDTSKIAGRTVTLDTGDVPFWEAFAQFCQKAGLSERDGTANPAAVKPNTGSKDVIIRDLRGNVANPVEDRLLLVDGGPALLPTFVRGSVRVRALATGSSRLADEVQLALDVTPEPSLKWDGLLDVRIDSAIDSEGRRLTQLPVAMATSSVDDMIWANGANVFIDDIDGEVMAGPRNRLMVRLQEGEQPSKRLKELSGVIALRIQKTEAVATVENLLQAADKLVRGSDGTAIKVVGVTGKAGGLVRLNLQVTGPQMMGGNQVIRANGNRVVVIRRGRTFESATPRLSVLDANGKALPVVARQNTLNVNGNTVDETLELTVQIPHQGEGLKLVLTGPKTHSLEVPFVLKDVPLP